MVRPNWDPELRLSHPPSADEVRRRFAEAPEAKGMLLVTPTDYGTCGDIKAIADVCHELGKPLIVDEAWGAHMPFHPSAPVGHGRRRGSLRHQRAQVRGSRGTEFGVPPAG